MKKSIAIVGLLAMTAAAHADLITLAVNGGYSTVTMAEKNSAIDKFKASAGSGATSTPFGGGFFVAAEAGVGLLPFLQLGPRIEYLQANQASISQTISGVDTKYSMDDTLTSFLVGANAAVDLPLTGLGFKAGVYGGYGYAVERFGIDAGGTKIGSLYAGGAFVGEVQAKIKYSIVPLVSVELLGGFRLANMGKLKDGPTEDSDISDFSGLNAGGGLSVGF